MRTLEQIASSIDANMDTRDCSIDACVQLCCDLNEGAFHPEHVGNKVVAFGKWLNKTKFRKVGVNDRQAAIKLGSNLVLARKAFVELETISFQVAWNYAREWYGMPVRSETETVTKNSDGFDNETKSKKGRSETETLRRNTPPKIVPLRLVDDSVREPDFTNPEPTNPLENYKYAIREMVTHSHRMIENSIETVRRRKSGLTDPRVYSKEEIRKNAIRWNDNTQKMIEINNLYQDEINGVVDMPSFDMELVK